MRKLIVGLLMLVIGFGLFGPIGVEAACYVFTQNLTLGSVGPEVAALQNELVAQGYLVMLPGQSTGNFDTLTQAGLAKWQAFNGIIPASGYFGPASRAKMNASCMFSTSSLFLVSDANSSINKAHQVLVSEDDSTDNIPVLEFDVKFADEGTINEFPITIRRTASSNGVSSMINAVRLVAHDNEEFSENIPNDCVNDCTITFDNLDINDDTVAFKVFVDANKLSSNFTSGDEIQVSVYKEGIDAELENGDMIPVTAIVGSVDGGVITFVNEDNFVGQPVMVVKSGTLSLRYSEGQSGALQAKFLVEVQANEADVVIPKNPFFGSVTNTKGQNAMLTDNSISTSEPVGTIPCGYELNGSCYILKAGPGLQKKVDFEYTMNFSPRQSFGGVYRASLDGMFYMSADREDYLQMSITPYVTNPVTIVGEISAFITKIQKTSGRNFDILGERLAGGAIYLDGKAGVVINDKVLRNGTRNFSVPSTVTAGKHSLQIKNSSVGDSNIVSFEVAGATVPPLPSKYPKITTPAGGETWYKGSSYSISWSGNTKNDDLQFYLMKKDGTIGAGITAIDKAAESGTFYYTPTDASTWQKQLPEGKDYVARVHIAGNPQYFETKAFTIKNAEVSATSTVPATPSIKVLSPNGGEGFFSYNPEENKMVIKWQATGLDKVRITLRKGGLFKQEIVNSVANTGVYTWAMPASLPGGSDYQIRIRDDFAGGAPKYFDDSDGKFTINNGLGLEKKSFVASVIGAITDLFVGN